MEIFKSDLSGKEYATDQRIVGKNISASLFERIKSEYPALSETSCLSLSELNDFRHRYIASNLQKNIGTLSELEKEVIEALHKNQVISDNIDDVIDEESTFGQRIADRIADFGGSWTFICGRTNPAN